MGLLALVAAVLCLLKLLSPAGLDTVLVVLWFRMPAKRGVDFYLLRLNQSL